jgi:hypothetical protein
VITCCLNLHDLYYYTNSQIKRIKKEEKGAAATAVMTNDKFLMTRIKQPVAEIQHQVSA